MEAQENHFPPKRVALLYFIKALLRRRLPNPYTTPLPLRSGTPM